jgi:hypothetical protein
VQSRVCRVVCVMHQHTSAYVSIRQQSSVCRVVCVTEHRLCIGDVC